MEDARGDPRGSGCFIPDISLRNHRFPKQNKFGEAEQKGSGWNGAKLRGIVVANEMLRNERDFVSLTSFSAMKVTLDRIYVGGLPSLPLETADRTTNGLNLAPFGSGHVACGRSPSPSIAPNVRVALWAGAG